MFESRPVFPQQLFTKVSWGPSNTSEERKFPPCTNTRVSLRQLREIFLKTFQGHQIELQYFFKAKEERNYLRHERKANPPSIILPLLHRELQ